MKLNPYPEYKDSGAVWLAKVPTHWYVVPNRSTFIEVNDQNHPDEEMLSVTISRGVIKQSTLLDDSSTKDGSRIDKSSYKLVKPGDIAYNKMRAWQGAIGVSIYRGIISPAYVVQRPREGNNPVFLHYLLRTPAFAKEAERNSYGITSDMWSLRPEHFKTIFSCIPPPEEQTAIVRFLDHTDELINRYIRAKERLIALLEEQRQAVIHQAVTRGLDPNVKLKPTNITGAPQTPRHWQIKRLKSLARIRYGLGQPPRESPTGLPLIRATNVSRGKITEDGMMFVDPTDVPAGRDAILKEHEIIVVRSGAYTADSAIIPKRYRGAVSGYDMVVTASAARPQFIALALLTPYVRDDQLIVSSTRAAQPHLNAEDLGAARILTPPHSEQQAIEEYAQQLSDDIDKQVTSTRWQVDLINEYRTRLIADVITGQIDVRDAAVELPH